MTTPARLPYEPMDERQRAIDMVKALRVVEDGDSFDLIARLLRQIDQLTEGVAIVRWQIVDRNLSIIGGALREEAQARAEAALYDRSHPHRAPHHVVQLTGRLDGAT